MDRFTRKSILLINGRQGILKAGSNRVQFQPNTSTQTVRETFEQLNEHVSIITIQEYFENEFI